MITLSDIIANIKKSQFASFTYNTKSTKETARYRVQLNTSYVNLLEKSLLECQLLDLSDFENEELVLARKEKAALLRSIRKSIRFQKNDESSPDYRKKGVYDQIDGGILRHKDDGSFEIKAVVSSKVVIEENPNLVARKKSLKNRLRSLLPIGKFRTFSFENLEKVKLAGFEFSNES